MTANAPIPAIANAIFDACGVRLESMPFTPEKILRGLDELAAAPPDGREPFATERRLGRGARAALRRSSATSPTRGCSPRCTWRSCSGGRSRSRASRAWARPSWPRCSPPSLGRELIRLQCYEGLDAAQALYEWDYPKQLLAVRVAEAEGREVGDLYDERFLLERPLLRTVRAAAGAVLLIDEIDRSDSEFEAFLLEFLSDFQITIPEVGTLRAARPPIVVLTSNRTRELHDALKRRCLYHWIPFPDAEREREILRAQAPGPRRRGGRRARRGDQARAQRAAAQAAGDRGDDRLGAGRADAGRARASPWPEALRRSLGLLLKEQEDVERVAGARLSF